MILPLTAGMLQATDTASHRWTVYLRHAQNLDLSHFLNKASYARQLVVLLLLEQPGREFSLVCLHRTRQACHSAHACLLTIWLSAGRWYTPCILAFRRPPGRQPIFLSLS